MCSEVFQAVVVYTLFFIRPTCTASEIAYCDKLNSHKCLIGKSVRFVQYVWVPYEYFSGMHHVYIDIQPVC